MCFTWDDIVTWLYMEGEIVCYWDAGPRWVEVLGMSYVWFIVKRENNEVVMAIGTCYGWKEMAGSVFKILHVSIRSRGIEVSTSLSFLLLLRLNSIQIIGFSAKRKTFFHQMIALE